MQPAPLAPGPSHVNPISSISSGVPTPTPLSVNARAERTTSAVVYREGNFSATVTSSGNSLGVGTEVAFQLDYSALLRAMASPFVRKSYKSAAHVSRALQVA